MTPEQFVYWMQGFAELNHDPPSVEQWQTIRDHLNLVLEKKTSNYFPGIVKDGEAHDMQPWGDPYVQTGLPPNWNVRLLRTECSTMTC